MTADPAPVLSVSGLTLESVRPSTGLRAGGELFEVFQDAALELPGDEVVLLVGPSGSGKSLFTKLLAGLVGPATATVRISHTARMTLRLRDGSEHDVLAGGLYPPALRGAIGYMFQYHALFDELTVEENIRFGNDQARAPLAGAAWADWVAGAAARLKLDRLLASPIEPLSGGQRQRASLLRMLALRPDVLVYDEPTSGLDPDAAGRVADMIREAQHGGEAAARPRTSLVVTHDYANLLRIADRVVILTARRGFEVRAVRGAESPRSNRLRSAPGRRSPPGDPLAARLDPEPRSEVEHSCSTSEVEHSCSTSDDRAALAAELHDALTRWEAPRPRPIERALAGKIREDAAWTALAAAPAAARARLLSLPRFLARSWRWHVRFGGDAFRLLVWNALPFGALGGLAIGAVLAYFSLNAVPQALQGQVEPIFIEEILKGLGLALYQVLGPLFAAICLAARSGAAVAGHVSSLERSSQLDALRVLGVPPALLLGDKVLLAFALGMPIIAAVAFAAGTLAALVVVLATRPLATWYTFAASYWGALGAGALDLPYRGTGWLLAKLVPAGLICGAIAWREGARPKSGSEDVNRAITRTIMQGILAVLACFFLVLVVEIRLR